MTKEDSCISFANVIIDISHEKVDRVFQYRIPAYLMGSIKVGMPLLVPFGKGNHLRKAYVVELTDRTDYAIEKIKEIKALADDEVSLESQMIYLAWWIKEQYGSTMNQALKTVLPVRQKVKEKQKRILVCQLSNNELLAEIEIAVKKHYMARARLFEAFLHVKEISYETIVSEVNISAATIKPLLEKKQFVLVASQIYRNPVVKREMQENRLLLNEQQQQIVNEFCQKFDHDIRDVSLIHGITGSGKTEVYIEMIAHVLQKGQQAIVLIPEIALTYQTVERFYRRFSDRVSIINSKLSKGERFDQFERAKKGDVSIMIGPRSALFTPFPNLGLIIIDEEHESAYKSEVAPRYHAREVAVKRGELSHASVILGSATPSLEAYTKALRGEYRLYQLKNRAKVASQLAKVEIIDLRIELQQGNKSIFSRKLQESIVNRLENREQIMLFINRRGYANFVSCRACGEAVKCPHCDVSLTLHNTGELRCHYCGHSIPSPKKCSLCGSPYIAHFGVGTQKLEQMTKQAFPSAKILRMDFDTTSQKGKHEQILSAFAKHQADILIGTQMIVKGHDFPNVTLVGVMAADLSLHEADFRSSERTFQLLTQAAGRAGRANRAGEVIIQTYQPDHYSIVTASKQDYQTFYRQEMAYRSLLNYPPAAHLLTIQFAAEKEDQLVIIVERIIAQIKQLQIDQTVELIGPVNASIYKVNDIYRKILYMKHQKYDILIKIKNQMDQWLAEFKELSTVLVQYDFA